MEHGGQQGRWHRTSEQVVHNLAQVEKLWNEGNDIAEVNTLLVLAIDRRADQLSLTVFAEVGEDF